jgi:hypothetical protein
VRIALLHGFYTAISYSTYSLSRFVLVVVSSDYFKGARAVIYPGIKILNVIWELYLLHVLLVEFRSLVLVIS